jgi:signal transduction histidine kinase
MRPRPSRSVVSSSPLRAVVFDPARLTVVYMLYEFVSDNREEILTRARARVASRHESTVASFESTRGLPAFLDQLGDALRRASSNQTVDHAKLEATAGKLGDDLFREGVTVSQVVNGYGDLCQVITGLATEQTAAIEVAEFQTLNLCLDEATAGAVEAFSRQRERAITEDGAERLGVLVHEMRNLLNGVMLAFRLIKTGAVSASGNTSAGLDQNLTRMQRLIDHSFADVRIDAGLHALERTPLYEIFDEVEIGTAMVAQTMGLKFVVTPVDRGVDVNADGQLLTAAIANLLHNAVKFTRAGTTVRLRAIVAPTRVLIEVEDECGGLPVEKAETLLRPFVRKGDNRSGLGLGLSICQKSVKALGGALTIRDRPGRGCIFAIDLPRLTDVAAPRIRPAVSSS